MERYEIYLPLKYNDGSNVEPDKLEQIQLQLIAVFGAISVSPIGAPYKGTWQYGGVEFIGDIIKIEVITKGDLSSNRFFRRYKLRLKKTLQQIDILITVQDVKTIQVFLVAATRCLVVGGLS